MRDEVRRNIAALKAFKKAFTKHRLKRLTFGPGPADSTMIVEKVRINCRLDLTVSETKAGVTKSGGCSLLFANTDASRKKIEERQKTASAVIYWELQEAGGNIDPAERLCLSFDVFGEKIQSAPKNVDRLRANIASSCREAAAQWDDIAPPPGYDGPDWH